MESSFSKASNNGDLIAVGADGRGGKVKVLRSPNLTFQVGSPHSLNSFGSICKSMQRNIH